MPGQRPPTMDDVWAPNKQNVQTSDDYARELGKGVMEGITGGITSIIGQTFSGLGKNGNGNGTVDPIDALVQAEAKKKALREYLGIEDDGRRRRRRDDDDEDDEDRPRRGAGSDKAIIELIRFMAEQQSKTIEKLDASTKEILKEMREDLKRGKGSDDPHKDILADVGLQLLRSRANGDPAEEERARRRAYFEEFEQLYGGNGRKTIEDRRMDLEEKRIELEHQRLIKQDEEARKAAEERNKMLSGFMSTLVGGGRNPGEIPLGGGSDGGSGEPKSRLYRYRCGACHKTFATVEPITHALCPHCGTEIGQGDGPPVNVSSMNAPSMNVGESPQTTVAQEQIEPAASAASVAAAMDEEVPY